MNAFLSLLAQGVKSPIQKLQDKQKSATLALHTVIFLIHASSVEQELSNFTSQFIVFAQLVIYYNQPNHCYNCTTRSTKSSHIFIILSFIRLIEKLIFSHAPCYYDFHFYICYILISTKRYFNIVDQIEILKYYNLISILVLFSLLSLKYLQKSCIFYPILILRI